MFGSNDNAFSQWSWNGNPSGVNILNSGSSSDPPKKSLGAVATVALPIIWEIGKMAYQYFTNRHNEQAAKDAATLAYERQVEQWNRENKYNSPISMLGRYAQAGLNPSLIYGGSGAIAGNAGQLSPVSPSFSNGSWSVPDLANSLTAAQIRNINSQTDLNEHKSSLTDAETRNSLKNLNLTDANIKYVQSQTNYLSRQFNILGFEEFLTRVKLDVLSDPNKHEFYVDIVGPDGSIHQHQDPIFRTNFDIFRRRVQDRLIDYFNIDSEVASRLCRVYEESVFNIQQDTSYKENLNKEQLEWLNHCGQYFKALSDQQTAVATLSGFSVNFFSKNKLGISSPAALSLATSLAHDVSNLLSSLVPKFNFGFGSKTLNSNSTSTIFKHNTYQYNR